MTSFVDRLYNTQRANKSLVCVGLDPDPSRMPVSDVFEFNKAIVDATKDLVCAFKPNLPFYESLGIDGLKALEKTIAHIRSVAPDVIVLGDGKRGDIASTNVHYAKALFEVWGFDAATVNAYAGGESLEPFFEYKDKGVLVWCRSSNRGAKEFQDIVVDSSRLSRLRSRTERNGEVQQTVGKIPLFEWMAERASEWNENGNVGLVVGATYPEELRSVRSHCANMPILIPGVGTQGGDLENSVKLGIDEGRPNIMISSSRGIIFASANPDSFEKAAREAAGNLREQINRILQQEGRSW